MAGQPYYTRGGSDTVEVSEPVTKGQVVEWDPDNEGMVRVARAGSTRHNGVAQISGAPLATNERFNFAPNRRHVSVQLAPLETRVIYAAAASAGDPLVCAADGQVTPAGETPAAGTLLGTCSEPGGVAAGAQGRIRLS